MILNSVLFGFAVKQPTPLGYLIERTDTFTFSSLGKFCANGSKRIDTATFSRGDVVGIGLDFGTRQIFFTKNGQLFEFKYTLDSDFSADFDNLFPFVSLYEWKDD
ncbi:hypothetical protein niasHS_000103 [Heterodera schachtii]|uniref:B30.2/SPRY domain-containing protein n=1 Tax=Heterodera schachtii TaxID=97005 RepID=A0ABD2K6Q0_HETSC